MQPLLLLHGAIGSKDQLVSLHTELSKDFTVYSLDFAGHGSSTVNANEFSIPLFAQQVLDLMDASQLERISIAGYSMGGYVAMYLALHHPARIEKIITLATKYNWDETIAAKEIKMLDAQRIEEKLPAFAGELNKRHGANDWKIVLEKTKTLLTGLGQHNWLSPEALDKIQTPVLLLSGDKDKMVPAEETLAVYRLLPSAQLGILPNTPHPIEQVNTKTLAFAIRQFMN